MKNEHYCLIFWKLPKLQIHIQIKQSVDNLSIIAKVKVYIWKKEDNDFDKFSANFPPKWKFSPEMAII